MQWKTGSPGPSLHLHWLVLFRITPKTFPVSQCRPRDDSRSQYGTPMCLIPCNRTEYIIIALLKTGIPKPLQVKKVRKKQTDHHGGIRHPCSVPAPSTTKTQHLSANKSASVGVVVSSTICQEIWEESCPPVHWVIGRQTSVMAGICGRL